MFIALQDFSQLFFPRYKNMCRANKNSWIYPNDFREHSLTWELSRNQIRLRSQQRIFYSSIFPIDRFSSQRISSTHFSICPHIILSICIFTSNEDFFPHSIDIQIKTDIKLDMIEVLAFPTLRYDSRWFFKSNSNSNSVNSIWKCGSKARDLVHCGRILIQSIPHRFSSLKFIAVTMVEISLERRRRQLL